MSEFQTRSFFSVRLLKTAREVSSNQMIDKTTDRGERNEDEKNRTDEDRKDRICGHVSDLLCSGHRIDPSCGYRNEDAGHFTGDRDDRFRDRKDHRVFLEGSFPSGFPV